MTFEQFLNLYYQTVGAAITKGYQRPGQYAMNLLWEKRPDLYTFVTGWYCVDPFYRDEFLPRFWEELAVKW